MAERRRKMQSSNADRDREEEEVMDLVGEIANGEVRSEKMSVALEDGVEVVVVEEEMAGEEMEIDEETDVRTVKLVGKENEEGESTPSKLSEMFEDSMRDWGSQEEVLAQVFKADSPGKRPAPPRGTRATDGAATRAAAATRPLGRPTATGTRAQPHSRISPAWPTR